MKKINNLTLQFSWRKITDFQCIKKDNYNVIFGARICFSDSETPTPKKKGKLLVSKLIHVRPYLLGSAKVVIFIWGKT